MVCGTEFCALYIHNLHDCSLYCVLSVTVYYVFFVVKKFCVSSFRVKFENWYSFFSPHIWQMKRLPQGAIAERPAEYDQ